MATPPTNQPNQIWKKLFNVEEKADQSTTDIPRFKFRSVEEGNKVLVKVTKKGEHDREFIGEIIEIFQNTNPPSMKKKMYSFYLPASVLGHMKRLEISENTPKWFYAKSQGEKDSNTGRKFMSFYCDLLDAEESQAADSLEYDQFYR